MPTSRIPRTIDLFNTFIVNTNSYMLAVIVPTNWSRLGWVQAEMTAWTAFVTQWNPLYVKYSDKKGGRTTAIKDQLLLIIKNCVALDKSNHLLDRIAAAPTVTISDMQTFHIKKGVLQTTTHTVGQTAISENVVASLKPIGGGDVKLKCRTINDGNRSSIAAGANSVQYTYLIATPTTAPAAADAAGLTKEISTKAAFTLHTGAGSTGKTLYIFFRWYNTKHPELAGPWSTMQSTVIL
jgi:hypothetical protein